MRTVILTYTRQFIIVIVALQVLNMSVHGGDFGRNIMLKNTNAIGSFNQIDCFGEFIFEEVLGLEVKFLFPDNNIHNHNSKTHAIFKYVDIKQPCQPIQFRPIHDNYIPVKYYTPLNISYHFLYMKEINPPPPKEV